MPYFNFDPAPGKPPGVVNMAIDRGYNARMLATPRPVLLAFAPADRFAADTISKALAAAGIASGGAVDDASVPAAIAAARVLIILHSRATAGDAMALRVAQAAAARRLPTLLVRVDDAKPVARLRASLRGMPSIDATGGKLPDRLAGIVIRARQAVAITTGDPDAVDDHQGGIDLWSVERRRISPRWLLAGAALLTAIAVLAWRGYDRAAAQNAFELGVARLAAGNLDGAATSLDQALQRRPDWAAAWRQRGFASRDSANQIASFSRAIALDPRDADSLAARGRSYLGNGDIAHARADLDAALKLVPGNAEWIGERGLVALLANDDSEAQRDFRECARLEPRCPQAFAARIGAVEAARGRVSHDWFVTQ